MTTRETLRNIASLSRIHLEDQELNHLTKDLEKILEYVAKLKKLDVNQVKPTSHVLPLKNVYRDDLVKSSLTQKEALQCAAAQHNGAFKVPKVIE